MIFYMKETIVTFNFNYSQLLICLNLQFILSMKVLKINTIIIQIIIKFLNQSLNNNIIVMQFSFKRPQTSSILNLYRNQNYKSQPKSNMNATELLNEAQQTKKWEQAAQKINKQMVLQKILYSNGQPFRVLTKIGGKNYNSQPKLINAEQSKNRIRISSKEKLIKNTFKDSIVIRHPQQQNFKFTEGNNESKIKKKKRNDKFRSGISWQKQIAMTNLFYESPIVKIGYNMQYDSYLRFEHISQVRPDHRTNINKNSIIFFLKDAPFSPNIISQKNQEIPISLSLFPEFFDSKLSESSKKRKLYFQKMLSEMNNTYDPQRMSLMTKFSTFNTFNPQKYFEAIQNISNGNEKNYKVQWMDNIVKKLKIKLTIQQFRKLLEQQWEFFNIANAMMTMDYILKDPKIAKRLQLSPYMATRISTAKNILYHGGYSQSLYVSWSNYVNKGKKLLSSHLNKYNSINQSIYDWYSNFENLYLYENHFFKILKKPVNIDLYKKIQSCKLNFSVEIIKNLWFRGVLCIYHFGRYLMRKEGEFNNLTVYSTLLQSYIKQTKQRTSQLNSSEQINHLYLTLYENFLKSLHKQSSVGSLEQLLLCKKDEESFKPILKNTEVMLNIQLGSNIQQSFKRFKEEILQYKNPIIKLNLVIDRQSIKFLEQEQDIMNTFLQIIKNMLAINVVGYKLECNFKKDKFAQAMDKMKQKSNSQKNDLKEGYNGTNCAKENNIIYYPQIYQGLERNSLQQSNQFHLRYKTDFTLEQEIKQILQTLKMYYKECYIAINQFEMYLPFIKLTTTQKIFGEGEGSLEQNFQKNLKIIAKYKQSVSALHKTIRINIFEVDCTIPIRILQERINEIEYIIQQNYINIIHEKIQQIDSQLNGIKVTAYNISFKTLTIEQIQQKLAQMKYQLKLLQTKCKKIAQMIMFCFENKRRIQGIVNYYYQLISKKQELHKEIDKIMQSLQQKRPQVQLQIEEQTISIIKQIQNLLQNVTDMETVYFQYANISVYLTNLKDLKLKFDKILTNILKYEQFIIKSNQKYDIENKISIFNHQKQRFQLMIQYWEQFYTFQQYYKEVCKEIVRKINFKQFKLEVQNSLGVIQKIKASQQKWWKLIKDKSQWKPIIHKTHQLYSKKFESDVQLSQKLMAKVQILTNFKIKQRHWQFYNLLEFKDIIFKDLSKLKTSYKNYELQNMNEQINFEYEIYLAYEGIKNQIKSRQLIIIDLNDSDILDLNNINQCIELLYNIQIDIQDLIQKDINKYYHIELEQLDKLAKITKQKLVQWGTIEQKYIKFLKFHITNDDYQAAHFENLVQLHRKLIKSYDIDNSLFFISKNIVMEAYLTQIIEELDELQIKIDLHLNNISMNYPRLYLLNKQQMLQFVSQGANIQKYLKKCLYWINKFTIKDGSIEKVGLRRQLTFSQPLYIQQMKGRVYTWMNNLQQLIKGRMKQYFKASSIIIQEKSSQELQSNFYENYPIQLSILDECINFTTQAEQAIQSNNIKQFNETILSRILFLTKQKKQIHKIILLMNFRDIIKKIIPYSSQITSNSFQWLKYPRFYRRSHIEIKVSFLNQNNLYAFNFLQENQLIFTDNVLIGNCLIGPSKYGKTSLIKYYAYLCGQQILIFDPRSIQNNQNCTSNLFNYIKVNSFTGNWLIVQRIDLLLEQQLKLLAQCMIAVTQNLQMLKFSLNISGNKLILNKNSRIFMTSLSSNLQIPARLCALCRPIWMVRPNKQVLMQIYLRSKCFNSNEINRVIKFFQEADNNCSISLQLINWIRKEQNLKYFLATNNIYSEFKNMLMSSSKGQQQNPAIYSTQQREKNLEAEILSHDKRDIMIYGQKSLGKTYDILNILKHQRYIILNIDDEMQINEIYTIVARLKYIQKEQYLVLKNGIKYYSFLRKNLDLTIIAIENNLMNIELGLFHDLKMINFIPLNQTEQTLKTNDQDLKYFRLLACKIFKQSKYSLVSSIVFSDTMFTMILKKLHIMLSSNGRVNQIHINFLKLVKAMIDDGYQTSISFLYSLFWTYGIQMQQKRFTEEMKNMIKEYENHLIKIKRTIQSSLRIVEEKFIKLLKETFNNKLLSFTQLIPSKNGRIFVSQSKQMERYLCQIQFIPQKIVTVKSNLIHNINLLRQKFDGTISLECKDWLTTILKFSKPKHEEVKYFLLRGLQMSDISNKMFEKVKKNGWFVNFPKDVTIVIDDVHLCSKKNVQNLRNLSENKFTIYSQGNKDNKIISMIKMACCKFVFGSKNPSIIFPKSLSLKINQKNITSIFNQYITSFCQQYIQIDYSIFLLINLSNSINRTYKNLQQQHFFWFKNPLILLQYCKFTNITQIRQNYVKYLIDLLPDQKMNLDIDIQKLAEPQIQSNNIKDIINTNAKYKAFMAQRSLIDRLLEDDEILQEIQNKQVDSIFFEKFVESYFTKQILDLVQKVSQILQSHHLIILSDNYNHITRIIKYVCKINKLNLFYLNQNTNYYTPNSVIYINLNQLHHGQLQKLEEFMKGQHRYSNSAKIIIKADTHSAKTKKIFQQFTFLKAYFWIMLTQNRKGQIMPIISTTNIGSSKQIIDEYEAESKIYEQLNSLASQHNFDDFFKQQFIRIFEDCRKDQIASFKFHRKITSEMALNIDTIDYSYAQIPSILQSLQFKKMQIDEIKKSLNNEKKELKLKLLRWQQKQKCYSQLIRYRQEQQNSRKSKLTQNCLSIFSKLQKIQKKIEVIQLIEFTRLKNNLKNNQNANLIQPLHLLLTSIHEKSQNISKEKLNQSISNFLAAPINLVNYLKNIRKRQSNEIEASKNRITSQQQKVGKINAAAMMNKMKGYSNKIDQINEHGKKYEKLSLIYKSIMIWMGFYQIYCQHYIDYNAKQAQIDNRLSSDLANISNKYGEEKDVQYLKANLQMLNIQNQNRSEQIKQRMKQVNKDLQQIESEEHEIDEQERFYSQRRFMLQRIIMNLSKHQYIKKISSGVSLYFKNIDNIIFNRTLLRIRLNQQFSNVSINLYELFRDIFTFKIELLAIRTKYKAQSLLFQQLQIIKQSLDQNGKRLSLIEDRHNMIKGKLIQIGQEKGYLIKEIKHSKFQDTINFIKNKLSTNLKFILVNENIYYLQACNPNNQLILHQFIQQLIQIQQAQPSSKIIYLTNYLPKISTNLYHFLSFGKISLTKQKFLTDASEIFNIVEPSDPKKQKQIQQIKRRSSIQSILSDRNRKLKQIISNIETVCKKLKENKEVSIIKKQLIQDQRDACNILQNNLLQLAGLEEQLDILQLYTTNYNYQSTKNKQIITKQLSRYYTLCLFTDYIDLNTNNQFFSTQSFYYQWLQLMKNIRQEKIMFFNRNNFRPIINQIVIKNAEEQAETSKQIHKTKVQEQNLNETTKVRNLNATFIRYNNEVFNCLTEKILKNTNWINRQSLIQYILGACLIRTLSTIMLSRIQLTIFQIKVKNQKEIIQQCTKLLKLCNEQVPTIKISNLIEQFLQMVDEKNHRFTYQNQEIIIFYYLYLLISNKIDIQLSTNFMTNFSTSLKSKRSKISQKYNFVKEYINIKLQSEVLISIKAPLSLTINFQNKLSNEKMINIIQQDKYLIHELIQTLKIKALSKKRQFIVLFAEANQPKKLIDDIKQYYKHGNKYWLYLANLSITESNSTEIQCILDQITSQLRTMIPQIYFRIFIVMQRIDHLKLVLYYNKYEINRYICHHSTLNHQYYRVINQMALESIQNAKNKTKLQENQSPGRLLIESFITITTKQDQLNYHHTKHLLNNLSIYFNRTTKKFQLFTHEDLKIYYKNIINELIKIGFLKGQQNQTNFYFYLSQYFKMILNNSPLMIKGEIQVYNELNKEGLQDSFILADRQINKKQEMKEQQLNLMKLQETLRNSPETF